MTETDQAGLDAAVADLNAAAERIWMACQADWPGLSVEVQPELASTNTTLMARADEAEPGPVLLTAASQTAGRGRQGRQWAARAGDSLAFSLGLPVALDAIPGGGSALSLAVGLAVAEALDALRAERERSTGLGAPQPLGLKWPNDLWLEGRKLGGILIEARSGAHLPHGYRWLVIGVGLNVRAAVLPGTACVAEGLPASARPTAGEAWTAVAPALLQGVRAFVRHGFASLQAAYAERDVLAGQPVALWTRTGADPLADAPHASGIATGVDGHGALLVHTDAGLRAWSSGDVTVRPHAS
ncbi:biotin--[acetyl-CoA-carboxylase] ligase [Aquabacterium olei]|nr:biotin--[acetyl-CoA-carboxylase] ligase [Aquabacterium olei]